MLASVFHISLVGSTATLLATLAAAQSFPGETFRVSPGDIVREFAPGDFDGDGDADLAISIDEPGVHVRWSDQGRYDTETVLSTGVDPTYDVAAADFDHDGDIDLAAITLNHVLVWRGDGAGNFAPLPSIPNLSGKLLAIGDFNGDGHPDIVAQYGGVARIYGGTGAGGFNLLSISPGNSTLLALAVADWNSDGRDDLAIGLGSTSPSVRCYLLGPGATFGSSIDISLGGAVTAVAAVDADGDGDRDLACAVINPSAPFAVCLGNGAGAFGAPKTTLANGTPRELCLADLDGDGRDELATTDAESQVTTLLQPIGDGLYAASTVLPGAEECREPMFADADGNGTLDLIACSSLNDRIVVTRNLGLGSFDIASLITGLWHFGAVAAGDLDGDGLDELVIGSSSLVVIRPTASGGLIGPKRYPPALSGQAIALTDVDEDGHLDALLARSGPEVLYLHGDGNAGFDTTFTIPTGGSAGDDLLVADFDGDSHQDFAILVTSGLGTAVELFLGDGAGGFTPGTVIVLSEFPTCFAAGDLDGDGDVDLAVGVSFTVAPSRAVWFANEGTGAFAAGIDLPGNGSLVRDVAIGNLDGDAHQDLLVATNGGGLEIFWGDAAATFAASNALVVSGTPLTMRIGDLDGDGIDDVAWHTQFSAEVGTLLGNAARTLGPASAFAAPQQTLGGVALGRFDGDGALDLAVTGSNVDGGLAVLHQTTPAGSTAIYCPAKQNSLACLPYVGWTGVPSASAGSGFVLSAHDVLSQKPGLFLYTTSGTKSMPFQGGTLCINAPIRRTPVQSSGGNPPPTDCSGSYSIDFNAHVALGLDPKLVAGSCVAGQFWSRDPGFAAPNNVGLTPGIRFVLQP
ncbi:MAG: VCBS repeat-containing protein [Planctomycetes bacterium]|nr:VCBS repeat-containing protein [Planctomycetota bacterium]